MEPVPPFGTDFDIKTHFIYIFTDSVICLILSQGPGDEITKIFADIIY